MPLPKNILLSKMVIRPFFEELISRQIKEITINSKNEMPIKSYDVICMDFLKF